MCCCCWNCCWALLCVSVCSEECHIRNIVYNLVVGSPWERCPCSYHRCPCSPSHPTFELSLPPLRTSDTSA